MTIKKQKTLKLKEFRNLVKKLVKEEILKECEGNPWSMEQPIKSKGKPVLKSKLKSEAQDPFDNLMKDLDRQDYSDDFERFSDLDFSEEEKSNEESLFDDEPSLETDEENDLPVFSGKEKDFEDENVDDDDKFLMESNKKIIVLEHRRKLINKILVTEAGFFDKMLGKVDPSSAVDDPKQIRKNVDDALGKADRFAKDFQSKVLQGTQSINAYHEAIKSALDKLVLVSSDKTLSGLLQSEYEPKIMAAAKMFYDLMKNEKDRLESFIKTLVSDLDQKGYDKSYLTVNKNFAKPATAFEPNRPKQPGFIDKAVGMAKDVASKVVPVRENNNKNKKK